MQDENITVSTPETETQEDQNVTRDAETQESSEKTYSQEELNEIIEKRMARATAQHKEELEKAVKDAEKKAKMSEEQLRKYEADAKDAKIKELESEIERGKLEKYAAQALKEEKIEATEDILSFVVGSTQEETAANIEKFVGITQAQLAAAESARAKGSTPKNYGANPNTATSAFDKVLESYKKR